ARVHTALCDWGTTNQADWYMKLLADALKNEHEYVTVLYSALAAARGSDLHYGNVHETWRKHDATNFIYRNAEQVKHARNSFTTLIQLLEKPPSVAPALPPLK
ncbi:MAG: hypothetical protein FWD53_01145, partial [Phycisphaerales bacterium]|nr:hypothetical protein [Phycisphaerales bacterium]